jgi:DNA-binding response OmpR family regulator
LSTLTINFIDHIMGNDIPYPLNPATIFLAEDDEDDVFLLTEALKDTYIPIILQTASNGDDLLQDISRHLPALPDYIFLDINMPGKNGYETLNALRSQLPLEVPICMLSTACDQDSIQRAMRLGATGYITKCMHFHEFTARLKSFLVSRGSRSAPVEADGRLS